MKKPKSFCSVCLAIIMVITLCACSQRGEISPSDGNELVVSGNESLSNENPFDISIVDKENSEVGFYSFGIDEIAELTLPETTVRLQISNGEIAQEIGFMVFVDGIPQPIGCTYCKPVSLAEMEESLHEVHFTPRLPAGKAAGEDSNILVSSILRPSFRPSEENGYVFGHCLSIRDLIPQDISASESIEGAPLVGLRCEDMTAIDEDFVLSELKTSLPQEGSSDIILLCQEADTKGSTIISLFLHPAKNLPQLLPFFDLAHRRNGASSPSPGMRGKCGEGTDLYKSGASRAQMRCGWRFPCLRYMGGYRSCRKPTSPQAAQISPEPPGKTK